MTKYDLNRFLLASDKMYNTALSEIKNGKKVSHWMWYIFPQIEGMGKSPRSIKYSLQLSESEQYFKDDVLKKRLIEISTNNVCAANSARTDMNSFYLTLISHESRV